jgi:glutamate-ammonia-ligase adenylyltransferase
LSSVPPLHLPPRPADRDAVARNRERWLEAAAEWDDVELAEFARAAEREPRHRALLDSVFGNSPFLTHCLIAEPAVLRSFLDHGPDVTFAELLKELRADDSEGHDEAAVMRKLRIGKRRASLLVGLADLSGRWTLESVTQALSRFADASVSVACAQLLSQALLDEELTLPHPADPEWDSGLVVLGMGKLGADELNYSSDIDLVILYDDEKIAYRGRRSVQELFVGMARDLVRILELRTGDGYVFRCDLRLRPDPASTPAALSVIAAETYYEAMGQNWERAAMIKARAIAGDKSAGESFLRTLMPFIWRKHLDFAAIQDIHSIKRQIDAHKGGGRIAVAGHDVKLGRGGIREIEFFVQTQQLIRGGREPGLRQARTLGGLEALAGAGHIDPKTAAELTDCYRFLRMVEHRLQMVDDRQTQRLPDDPEQLAAIATFAGFGDLESFDTAMRGVLRTVERHYARLFEDAPSLGDHGNLVFTGAEDDPDTIATLASLGFKQPATVCARIRGWHHGHVRAMRSGRARETLTEITPVLLAALGRTADPDAAFMRFDSFLFALPTGVQLFSLLYAKPELLDLIAELMGNAPRLADMLSRRPGLFDVVVSGDFFRPLPSLRAMIDDLKEAILREGHDLEDAMDAARRWAAEQRFRVGVQLLRNAVVPERAAEHLSDIADAAITCLLPHVEADFARAHGHLPGRGLALLALGKLGSREMTANSDLDLILIYDQVDNSILSDGRKPVPPETYYGRLTQRLIAGFTAATAEGTLYDVDMRLRPSGNKGPIAASLESFRIYHRKEAWTWERMALTRARVIVAAPAMRRAVARVIRDALVHPRDPEDIRRDVADMRERMAAEHKANSPWEVKHRRGGLVDIEFIAQYLQLRWGRQHTSLLKRNTVAVLREATSLKLLSRADADALLAAHHLWTSVQQVLRVSIEGMFDEASLPGRLGEVLAHAAGVPDFATLESEMRKSAVQARAVYQRLLASPAKAELTSRTEETK